jgi:egghead protein (zeste-white 4 protein)
MTEILLPIIVLLNISYVYFWLVVIYARSHKHIDKKIVRNVDIKRAAAMAIKKGDPYLLTIQITTKGGSIKVVQRGIEHALHAVIDYPKLRELLKIEIITEDASEKLVLEREFADAAISIKTFVLPTDYQTPNGTQLKARALEYMVEQHRADPQDAYIIHYDEESVFTSENLARLAYNLLTKPVGISEGSISYGLDWKEADLICRTMESNRPFGCHECYLMMTHPAPLHLHGSNLVIQEKIENEIGWDIGQFKDKPLIAEDLVFGLMAYLKFGKSVFGWHHVEMIEQPPFTVKAARKQRERWVMGALQGVNHVRTLDGYENLSLVDRLKIQVVIRARIFTYAIGLPVSLLSLLSWTFIATVDLVDLAMGVSIPTHLSFLALPGLLMWIGATQIGLVQNLGYTNMNKRQKFVEHLKVLVTTPIAGLYDTAGPFIAVCKWATGTRGIHWQPTPKNIGQEIGEAV